jgi:dihydropteroate synthase
MEGSLSSSKILLKPRIMGILNATPDSFYSPSRVTLDQGIEQALEMEFHGADCIDIGGESTRPGAQYIEGSDELDRVIPLIQGIRKHSTIPISVDTRKCKVAQEAIHSGANFINDVSALEDDPKLEAFVIKEKLPVFLMHKQGTPETMQLQPVYADVVKEVIDYLRSRAEKLVSLGHPPELIYLDPGIGFGKTYEHNTQILARLNEIVLETKDLCAGVLLGYSRKGFLGTMLASPKGLVRPVEDRLYGGISVGLWAIAQGVSWLRVHEVKPLHDAIQVWWTIQSLRLGKEK